MGAIRRFRLHFKVRTPVHIGASGLLGPNAYTVTDPAGSSGGRVVVFSERRLLDWLVERGLASAFVTFMERQHTGPAGYARGPVGQSPLETFLQQFYRRPVPWDQLAAYAVPWYGWRDEPRWRRPSGSIRPFLRDGRHRVLIPGSSVRGAMREAILGQWAVTSETVKLRIEDFTRRKLDEDGSRAPTHAGHTGGRSGQRRYPASELDKEFFARLKWVEESKRVQPPHRDVLRAVKVADVSDPSQLQVAVYLVVSWSLRADGTEYVKHAQWVECLEPGSRFAVDVSFDPSVLRLGIRNPQELPPVPLDARTLVEALARWANAVWSAEGQAAQQYPLQARHLASLRSFYGKGSSAGFRMGWGSGWLGTTLGPLLQADTRRAIGAVYFNRHRQSIFPKSRRLAVLATGDHVPMGWLDVEDVEAVR